jgi:hypothetical protein
MSVTSGVDYQIRVPAIGLNEFDAVARSIAGLTRSIGEASKSIDQIAAQLNRTGQGLQSAAGGAQHFQTQMHGMSASTEEAHGSIGMLTEGLGEMAAAVGIAFSVEKVVEWGNKILEVTAEYQGFQNRIKFASIDTADAGANMDYLSKVVKDMHLPVKQVFDGFSQMEGGLKGTAIQGDKLRNLFTGVSAAAASLHLGDAELQRTLYDFKEIGERGLSMRYEASLAGNLPGINDVVRKTFGKSMHELQQAGMSGTDFLAKLGPGLFEYFKSGLANFGSSLQASINDTANAVYLKQVEVGEKLEGFYLGLMSDMRGFVTTAGDAVIESIDFIGNHFGDVRNQINEMSIVMAKSLSNIDTGAILHSAGEVFNEYVHNIWSGLKPLIESIWQFKDQAIAVFGFIGQAVGGLIRGLGEYFGFVYKVMAGVIDVLHTVYVILDKLGIIGEVVSDFKFIGAVLEGMGKEFERIYNDYIKPILDAISKAYHMVKDLLGIKDSTLNVKYEAPKDTFPYAPNNFGFGWNGKGEQAIDPFGTAAETKGKNDNILAETRGGVSAAGAGNHVRNVIVTIEKFVGIENMTYDHAVHNTRKIEQVVSNMFTNSIRDSEIALGQQ